MYISHPISSLSTLLLLLLTLPLTLAQNWTATDGSNISAAPGTFVLVLTSAKDSPTNTPSLSLWTETTPTVSNMPITMCSSSDPWQAFTAPDLPYPIGLHNSAKWCGEANSDGLWLSYYDRFQMDVSTATGVCGYFYTTSKLSWVCYLEANPDGRKYGC